MSPVIPSSITISTFGDLVIYPHYLLVDCPDCKRQTRLEPSSFPAAESYIKRIWRCGQCGGRGYMTIHQIGKTGGY